MRYTTVLAMAVAAAAPLAAQTPAPRARVFTLDAGGPERAEEHRAALGIGTSSTGTARDTLGLMITSVTRNSPAERAGLEEGNRIAAINGVSLRVNAADVEDAEMSGTLSRRLVRELGKVKPGDDVELRVYRDGRTSSVKVKTADSDSLFGTRERVRFTREDMAERPSLGIGLGNTGSKRDTLGVLVMSVLDDSPAARAGLEEGNRIAAIDGVSLRVAREDAGDGFLGSAKAQRLQREIAQKKAGSDVTLRVYANGQFRDVKVRLVRAGDLPKGSRNMMFFGGDGMVMPPMPPMPAMPSMAPMAPMVRIAPMLRDLEQMQVRVGRRTTVM